MFARYPHRRGAMIWDPQPSITAHELALALPLMPAFHRGTWGYGDEKLFLSLPEDVQRHFRRQE